MACEAMNQPPGGPGETRSRRTRARRHPAAGFVVTALVAVMLATPSAVGASLERMGGPPVCVGISLSPPDVAVGRCTTALGLSDEGGAPSSVSATMGSDGVEITWAPPADASGIEGYRVYRGYSPVTLAPILVVGPDTTQAVDQGPQAGQPGLWYAVETIQTSGEGGSSRAVLATPS